jgi:hypothetical protein
LQKFSPDWTNTSLFRNLVIDEEKSFVTLAPGDWQSSEQHHPERKYNNHLENVFLKPLVD